MESQNQLKFEKKKFYIILFLILIGIGLCAELGYIFYKTNFHDTFAPSFCNVSELIDCDGVARTNYAVSMGVPNALWGMILYLIMLMLLFVDRIQLKFKKSIFNVFKNPSSYIAILGLVSFAISMILAFISIAIIHKICALCFCTYFINFLIAVVAKSKEGYWYDLKVTLVDFVKGARKYFTLFIIVLVGFISTLIYLDRTMIFSPLLKRERAQKEFYQAKENKYAVKGNILGKKDAPVVINVYSDYNCPFCRVVNIMVHKAAKRENIIVNEINFPLDTYCNKKISITLGGHESSCIYAQYALAAKKQGKFWGAANILFDKHPTSLQHLIDEMEKANLDIDYEQLRKDANSEEVKEELQNDIETTYARQIFATPTIEINGEIFTGALPYEVLIEKIREAEKKLKDK